MKTRKLGIILKGFPRLSETFILNELLLLEKAGYRLHIYALRDPGEKKIHPGVKQLKAPVRYIPDDLITGFRRVFRANWLLFQNRPFIYLREFSLAFLRTVSRRSFSTLKRFLQAAYFVHQHVVPEQLSWVHAHFSHGPTTVAYFVRRLCGVPYSFTAHAKDIYVQEKKFFRQKIDQARFVVTCTQYNRDHMKRLGGTTPIYCIYHGVDLSRFTAPYRMQKANTPPLVLSVGRLIPKKGFPVLIRAIKILQLKQIRVSCLIIGSGPMASSLKRLISELDLGASVRILSSIHQDELVEWYRKADLFALASEVQPDGDRDGIPNVLVESMAMSVPVVATRVSGIPELIKHRINGLLVPAQNPEALAEALEELILRPEWANQLAQNARAVVERDFDVQKNIGMLCHLFDQALGLKPTIPGIQQQSIHEFQEYAEEVP